MKPGRPWRRWVLALGGALVLVVAAGGWVWFSDVGIPQERHASAPDPCELVSDETVRDLAGEAAGVRTDPESESSWGRPLSRPTEVLRCRWQVDPDEDTWNTVEVQAQVYHGTKFGLGMTGAEKAAALFPACVDLLHEVHEWSDEQAYVCARGGSATSPRLGVNLLQENLIVEVLVYPDRPAPLAEELPWDPEEEAVALADEVLARLDQS